MVTVKIIKPGEWSVELNPTDKHGSAANCVALLRGKHGLDARQVKGKQEVHVLVRS